MTFDARSLLYRDSRARRAGGGNCGGAAPGAPTVVISGGLATGGLLTCTPTAAAVVYGVSGPVVSWTYQWYRGVGAIGGATSITYLATALDSGTNTTCVATPSNPVWGAGPSGTSNIIVVPAISKWVDQSASARSYEQAVAANRPKADSLAGYFDANDSLAADATVMGAGGARTVLERVMLTVLPGVADIFGVGTDVTQAGAQLAQSFFTGLAGYQPWTFHRSGAGSSVGVAEALGLGSRIQIWTENGAQVYTARVAGVAKPVVASGAIGYTSFSNLLGTYRAASTYGLQNGLMLRVVWDGVLSAANQLTAEALAADTASTAAQYGALGTMVQCMLPGVGWS